MPRKFFKRISPDPKKLSQYQSLGWLNSLMHDTQLWGFKRSSVAKGCAIGIFCCMIPMPLQMLLAAAIALIWRANIPLSVALVWISNPLTMPPMLYANYKLGTWILQTPSYQLDFEWSKSWLLDQLHMLWKPLYTGSFTSGFVLAVIAFFTVQLLWSWKVKRNWLKRKR
ncbi:DUF2062 domain-containing protein [Candidatus Njordibacter sp. Uisw_056]|jgi:uncharacterized protein (DUF2062 family)|uniref:DUF2062 domain-containing protein n=1 Tax=Candidatus Njordibacter sp. Uisw_056 TaxID=3230973 RepID=UPI003D568AB2|tara:strand:+ start:8956 stop:9462 length:507 start_codon:yes stop_codon:yes gene_type:complete